MDFTIDRSLPISIRQQLKGLIEYAIACGDAAPGEPLPSVRDLASALGVAPMTVSQAYSDLKGLGLIETRAGSGTFIAESGGEPLHAQEGFAALHGQIDALIDKGLSLGLRTSDVASLIHARLASRARLGRRKSIAVVGLFGPTTARYARLIAEQIGPTATVEPATMNQIQQDSASRSRIASSDLVVTFVNRRREVASLLPGARVVGIRFVPAEETRRALAAIESGARLLLVARVPEFLPIMKSGVTRFATSLGLLNLTAGSAADITSLAAEVDALVYASGTEDVLATIPQMLPTIEYRHIPDPVDVQRRIASLLDHEG